MVKTLEEKHARARLQAAAAAARLAKLAGPKRAAPDTPSALLWKQFASREMIQFLRRRWDDETISKMVTRARSDPRLAFGRSDKTRVCAGVSDETRGKPGVVATSLSGCLFRLISTANGDGKATVNNTCAKAMERGSFKDSPCLVFTAFGDVVNREVEAWLLGEQL